MNQTKIEYTNLTWNPITGCEPGLPCWDYCWARRMATRLRGRCGYDQDEPFKPTFHPERLGEPVKKRKPRRIAVCFMGDIAVAPREWQHAVFYAMCKAPQHTYLLLTKRPELLRESIKAYGQLPDNVILGTSIADQADADERIPTLLDCPGRHWLSVEPMQGPVGVSPWLHAIQWVVAGGGPTPVHPDWVRSLRDQCQAAGVPFYFKQWGAYAPATRDCHRCDPNWVAVNVHGRSRRPANEELMHDDEALMRSVGKRSAGAMLDGREWRELPSE